MKTVTLVEVDDWVCIYIDGKDVFQGHSANEGTVLELVKDLGPFNLVVRSYEDADERYVDENGGWFPGRLEDLLN